MAIIYKRERSPYWWIDYMIAGKRCRESTLVRHQDTKRPPRNSLVWEIVNKVESKLAAQKFGLASIQAVSPAEFFKDYLASLATEVKPVTLIAYECNARRLCAWCDAQKFNSLSDLDFAKTNQYATEQRAVRSSVGVKMEIALFRRAWEKAKKMKHVAFDENPWSMTFKTSTAEKEPYSDEEIRAIFGLAMPQWLRVFCMVALYTGGRIGSIRLLTWEDLDCDVGVVHFRSSKTGPYSVPMHPVLLRFLQPIRGQGLIRAGQTDQVTSSLVVATLRKLSRKPVTKGGLGWTAHFHRFRHTFNTALMQSGVSRTVAMHLMNHRSEKVNSVYSHVDVLKFSKELERLTFGAPMAH